MLCHNFLIIVTRICSKKYIRGTCIYIHFQAIIHLNSDGDFILHNEGKRPIYLGGKAIFTGKSAKLQHQPVLELGACVCGGGGRWVGGCVC